MTAIELVKEYFPEVDNDTAGAILWARTGFPAFFDGNAETVMRRQLKEAREDYMRVTVTGRRWEIDPL